MSLFQMRCGSIQFEEKQTGAHIQCFQEDDHMCGVQWRWEDAGHWGGRERVLVEGEVIST